MTEWEDIPAMERTKKRKLRVVPATEIMQMQERIEELEYLMGEYREYVRGVVARGLVKGEVSTNMGISLLSKDSENDDWFEELREKALQDPNSLSSQYERLKKEQES